MHILQKQHQQLINNSDVIVSEWKLNHKTKDWMSSFSLVPSSTICNFSIGFLVPQSFADYLNFPCASLRRVSWQNLRQFINDAIKISCCRGMQIRPSRYFLFCRNEMQFQSSTSAAFSCRPGPSSWLLELPFGRAIWAREESLSLRRSCSWAKTKANQQLKLAGWVDEAKHSYPWLIFSMIKCHEIDSTAEGDTERERGWIILSG